MRPPYISLTLSYNIPHPDIISDGEVQQPLRLAARNKIEYTSSKLS